MKKKELKKIVKLNLNVAYHIYILNFKNTGLSNRVTKEKFRKMAVNEMIKNIANNEFIMVLPNAHSIARAVTTAQIAKEGKSL